MTAGAVGLERVHLPGQFQATLWGNSLAKQSFQSNRKLLPGPQLLLVSVRLSLNGFSPQQFGVALAEQQCFVLGFEVRVRG